MDFQVRQYQSSDFEIVAPMAVDMHVGEHGVSHLTAIQFARTVQEFSLNPAKGEILVIEDQHNIMGYAILVYFWSNDWTDNIVYLDELYVSPAFRNRALGYKFLSYLKERFKEKAAGVMLETTQDKTRAAHLYERFGFVTARNKFWELMFKDIEYPNTES